MGRRYGNAGPGAQQNQVKNHFQKAISIYSNLNQPVKKDVARGVDVLNTNLAEQRQPSPKSNLAAILRELPYNNSYYLDNFGIDKLSYANFLLADKFAYDICAALETAEYESSTYSPFYP